MKKKAKLLAIPLFTLLVLGISYSKTASAACAVISGGLYCW
jgi:hypothetical protein